MGNFYVKGVLAPNSLLLLQVVAVLLLMLVKPEEGFSYNLLCKKDIFIRA